MLGAYGMQKCHQEVLRKNRVSLASQLVLTELMEHLIEKNIITETMMETIQAKSGNFSQNIEFLNLLPKRGPKAFSAFCEALRETKQQHLEEMLLSTIPCHRTEAIKRPHCYDQSFPFPVPESCESQKRLYQNNAVPMEHSLDDGDGPHYSQVKPCTPEFYHTHAHLAYKLKSRPRGLALILSNVHFSSETDLELRSGGNVDNAVLDTLFKHLGYQVFVKHDQTAQEMKEQLEIFSKHPVHQNVDSCIVSLLSHGIEGGVYGVDGKLLQLQEIFSLFDNANCPKLQNKPKMFFIQACRGYKRNPFHLPALLLPLPFSIITEWNLPLKPGIFHQGKQESSMCLAQSNHELDANPLGYAPVYDETDRGVDQIDGNDWANSPGCEESDANKKENPKLRLPTCSDMICGYACLKGTAAMRNTKRGSWYIEALSSVFAEDARNMHVADMLVKVNRLIKHREGHAPGTEFHRCKEMSEYCSTLCQDLYLFPGIVSEN